MTKTKFNSPAAQVLYDTTVNTVLQSVDRLRFDCSDLPGLFLRLKTETETAQVLIFSAYLEDKIQELLKLHLKGIETKSDDERLFGVDGLVGSFSKKILMARHLGWIAGFSANQLDAWRKLRNEFAHAAYRISFADQRIASLWDKIDKIDTFPDVVIANLVKEFKDIEIRALSQMPEPHRRLVRFVSLAVSVFHQLLVLPVAQSWSVAQVDVMECGWSRLPAPVKEVWENGSQAIIAIAKD